MQARIRGFILVAATALLFAACAPEDDAALEPTTGDPSALVVPTGDTPPAQTAADAGPLYHWPPATTTPPGGSTTTCVGGPPFDPRGATLVGNHHGLQMNNGQCLDATDCASGCCAKPCGICSSPGLQFASGKLGCGFVR